MSGAIHIVGAGVAGLCAAVALSQTGRPVTLHEAAPFAGGRCRTYVDATLGIAIDNGNHLVLAGNTATVSYVKAIGASDRLVGPQDAVFDFIDLKSRARWRLRPNLGRVPWWLLSSARRAPGTSAADYLGILPVLRAARGKSIGKTIGEVMQCSGPVYERVWRPLLLAALNTDPAEASAQLAGAVIRESLAKGGWACRPLVAVDGLAAAFVDPALAVLRRRGAAVRLGSRLRAVHFEAGRAAGLDFGADVVSLGASDVVVLAAPGPAATVLVPGLQAPTAHRAIVNGHFLFDPPAGLASLTGIVNGVAEWLFAFPNRLSVTVSAGDRLLDVPRETLALSLWADVQAVIGVDAPLPPWQIIRERRATFACLPEQDLLRPATRTAWANLLLAGDYTQTGLPATLEGAVRSGLAASAAAGGPKSF